MNDQESDEAVDVIGTRDVVQRALLGLIVLIGGLSVLGGIGNLVIFDGAVGDAEADIVQWVAENRIGVADSVFTIVSTLSDTWTVIGVVVGAVTMSWASGHGRHAATMLVAVFLELVTFFAVGAIVDRPRPDVEVLHSVPSTPSFPSGHVAAAFVLYGSLVLIARSISPSIPRAVWSIPIVIALAVAAARVYEGVHNPTDVAAGYLLGVAALVVAVKATGLDDVGSVRSSPPHGASITRTS